MIQYAAFGWMALEWWTWPLMFTVVMGAMVAGLRLDAWWDGRRERAAHHGKYPCLRHLDSERERWELYCGDVDGHDGPHGRVLLEGLTPKWSVSRAIQTDSE